MLSKDQAQDKSKSVGWRFDQQRKRCKAAVKHDRHAHLHNLVPEIEEANVSNNRAKVFSTVKRLTPGNRVTLCPVLNSAGESCTTEHHYSVLQSDDFLANRPLRNQLPR